MAHRQMYSIARLMRQTAVLNRIPATVRSWSSAREVPPPNNVLRFVEDYWDIISNYVREPGKTAVTLHNSSPTRSVAHTVSFYKVSFLLVLQPRNWPYATQLSCKSC
jgi:hypothetical protein